jgi:hypothetical protein
VTANGANVPKMPTATHHINNALLFIILCLSEYNERVGQMTHYGCEPSWNFLPQEYALPETITAFRIMVKRHAA